MKLRYNHETKQWDIVLSEVEYIKLLQAIPNINIWAERKQYQYPQPNQYGKIMQPYVPESPLYGPMVVTC
jgi:hypothetical protein